MKFSTLAFTVMSLLAVHSAFAGPADINCTVMNSNGTTLDFSVDTDGRLVGLTIYKSAAPTVMTNFPVDTIPNFWVDLGTMKVHGVDPTTHQQSIFIGYDRNLKLGKITMALPGYSFADQILTCDFD
jgi:hypothetical protein